MHETRPQRRQLWLLLAPLCWPSNLKRYSTEIGEAQGTMEHAHASKAKGY